MRRVYIVLSTAGVGGAEKRFTDIWSALARQGMDIHLVMDRRTHSALLQQRGYGEKLASAPNLHVLDFGGLLYRQFLQAVWKFFSNQPRGAIVHYPLAYAPFVQTSFGHRLVVSWVDSAMPPVRAGTLKRGATAWAGFLAANRIDVLNPGNLRSICRFPSMRGKASLTAGGTQIDPEIYRPLPKGREFVFLGRIEPEKQSLRFVEALPDVHLALQTRGFAGYRFVVCGDGSETAAIQALVDSKEFSDLPLSFGYSNAPEAVLGRASVFFSLQRTSNYPSKALAEAMACGAYPVMTATGETALMVDGCAAHCMVPRDFTSTDIANALLQYLDLDDTKRERLVVEISQFAKERFSQQKQVAYFADLYSELGSS